DRVGVRAVELLALLDGLLERGEDVLRQHLPHERHVEHVLTVEFADRRLGGIDRGLDGLRRGDRLDRLLTRVTGNHQHISSNYLKSPSFHGDMILEAGSSATKTPSLQPAHPPAPRSEGMFTNPRITPSLLRSSGKSNRRAMPAGGKPQESSVERYRRV